MKREIAEFILAENFLKDNLESMIEEGKFDEEKILKRIEVVNKFKSNLENIMK